MTAIAQDRPADVAPKVPALGNAPKAPTLSASPKVRRMTLERWRNWKPADGWKYDWNNGIITKSKKMVSEKQRFIVQNILDAFYAKGLHKQGGLMPEPEMSYDNGRHRVSDLAYFSKQQTLAAAKGEHGDSVAAFLIEVISDNDTIREVEKKIWEYFENGVQVLWQVFPEREVVKVYTSPLENKICIKEMVCSAAPALPGFDVTVNQIFQLEA